MVALRFNPSLRIFGERLSAAGKHPRLINGAVMRKLLVLAYGIFRSRGLRPQLRLTRNTVSTARLATARSRRLLDYRYRELVRHPKTAYLDAPLATNLSKPK